MGEGRVVVIANIIAQVFDFEDSCLMRVLIPREQLMTATPGFHTTLYIS